jgi:hypothetical protein
MKQEDESGELFIRYFVGHSPFESRDTFPIRNACNARAILYIYNAANHSSNAASRQFVVVAW